MDTATLLANYFKKVFGEIITIKPTSPNEAQAVPLFLRTTYQLVQTDLLHRKMVLAIESERSRPSTPREYGGHAILLGETMKLPVVLVLRPIPGHVRNRLVRLKVPFIVPNRQMFLPFMALDLQESRLPRILGSVRSLTGAAQAVLLGHILGLPVEELPLGDVAARFGYSAMTLSKVAAQLESTGLATVTSQGRARFLQFRQNRQELWDAGFPHLANPIQDRKWVQSWSDDGVGRCSAGLTALAHYTDILDDPLPTYAMTSDALRTAIRRNTMVTCNDKDDAVAVVEGWRYDPQRLATGDICDPLSLYLALHETADERVQQQLQRLLKDVSW